MNRNRIDEKPMPTANSFTNRRNRLDEKMGGIATRLTKNRSASIIINIFSEDIKGSARLELADPYRSEKVSLILIPFLLETFTKTLPFFRSRHADI